MRHSSLSAATAFPWETVRCGLYFIGQNLFFLLTYMYLSTYFTDIGIPVLAVAAIAAVVKVWDAFSTPIFAGLLTRIQHSRRLKPVIWLAVILVPLLTAVLFSIPYSISTGAKILWAAGAYLLWTAAYSVCSIPLYCMNRRITALQRGHTVLNSVGRICAAIAAMVLIVTIPTFRGLLGGWKSCVGILALLGLLFMIPICPRSTFRSGTAAPAKIIGLRQMLRYIRGNRYLSIYYLAFLIIGTLNVASCWGLYLARHCLRQESILSLTGILTMIPGIVLGAFLPTFARRIDKFRLYYYAVILSLVMQLVRYLVGYENLSAFLICTLLAAVPAGITKTILFRFTTDFIEYGRFMGQDSDPRLPFTIEIFFVKLQSAASTVVSMLVLLSLGFVEGEGAIQSAGFANALWGAGLLIPAVGMLAGLMILRHYDLNDHDVALMILSNEGTMPREEARRQMSHQYSA